MLKKLYYTTEYEFYKNLEFKEPTGNKSITLYTIEDNVPKKFGVLDLSNEDIKESIMDYLNDNGYEDENIELIQL